MRKGQEKKALPDGEAPIVARQITDFVARQLETPAYIRFLHGFPLLTSGSYSDSMRRINR